MVIYSVPYCLLLFTLLTFLIFSICNTIFYFFFLVGAKSWRCDINIPHIIINMYISICFQLSVSFAPHPIKYIILSLDFMSYRGQAILWFWYQCTIQIVAKVKACLSLHLLLLMVWLHGISYIFCDYIGL